VARVTDARPKPATWLYDDGPLASQRSGFGPRIVFVHGFTQTARSWLPVAETFLGDHEVVLVDAPGHGRSGHVRADLSRAADMLAQVGGRATYVGYSMGGRLCLHLAIAYPHLVHALALVGATPGLHSDDERQARRASDEKLAVELETDGVGPFLERWLAQPMFARLPAFARDIEGRMENTAEGLASSLRLAGTGAQSSLWDRIRNIGAPTLVLAGEHDAKFDAIGRQMARAIGRNATFRSIPSAGHAAHLEQPFAVAGALREFLSR
jgi:2-succinyl-6-hydroxy-2,4-cyclohexadiene-1-carboxylate synthase